MKVAKLSLFLFAAALFASSAAFARESSKTSLRISETVTVDGKQLNPGQYTVSWAGSGSSVQVTILQGKQAVATFPAHLAEQGVPNPGSAYGTSTEPDGSHSLTSIYVGGKRTVLELEQKDAHQQTSSTSAK